MVASTTQSKENVLLAAHFIFHCSGITALDRIAPPIIHHGEMLCGDATLMRLSPVLHEHEGRAIHSRRLARLVQISWRSFINAAMKGMPFFAQLLRREMHDITQANALQRAHRRQVCLSQR
jgi:hypothetical protein